MSELPIPTEPVDQTKLRDSLGAYPQMPASGVGYIHDVDLLGNPIAISTKPGDTPPRPRERHRIENIEEQWHLNWHREGV